MTITTGRYFIAALILFMALTPHTTHASPSYVIVDTGQNQCFNDSKQIDCVSAGRSYSGQDGQYQGNQPAYRDNGDGTITDLNTGLIWQKTPDFKAYSFRSAKGYADDLTLGGHDDWRLPTIKELFSIADFMGNQHTETPYLDTRYFDYIKPLDSGDPNIRRSMDGQYWSSTQYLGTTMGRDKSAFGFNFADGRIKSYPIDRKKSFVRCVRGAAYGANDFKDNGDGTVTDRATGLTWQKGDSGKAMTWKDALAYARNANLAGHTDWRLPNVKELQSIVDYSRAPDALDSDKRGTAIDPIFDVSKKESWYWSSTTFLENIDAYYVAFGQAFSAKKMQGKKINAHGAGAVRSDPKSGDPNRWAGGHGPQSDEIRIYNYVRLVRGGTAKPVSGSNAPIDLGTKRKGQQGGQQGSMSQGRQRQQGGPPQEMGQGPGPDMFIQRFDQNGDGVVSRDEFHGPAEHFKQFDRNNDGVIDSDEAPTGPPAGGPQRHKQ